jgi:hypothetical protein
MIARGALRTMIAVAIAAAAACKGSSETPAVTTSASGSGGQGTGGAQGCPAGTFANAGKCVEAGVPPEACAPGFMPEAGGCRAILPADPCPTGTMAVPGESACREVAPCGQGKYGDEPLPAGTLYVEAGAQGGNGSLAAPFGTLGAAIVAASAGGTIAIAAGTYSESVTLYKPLTLRGRCPKMVEIVGLAGTAVTVDVGASGTVITKLAVSGLLNGIEVLHKVATTLDRVYVHDAFVGMLTDDADVTVTGSLFETAQQAGIGAVAGKLTLKASVLRNATGLCAFTAPSDGGAPAVLSVSGSVIERCADVALLAGDTDATFDASVIRALTSPTGSPIALFSGASLKPPVSKLALTRSLITGAGIGIIALATDTRVEHSTVRELHAPSPYQGRAIETHPADVGEGTTLVRASLIDRVDEVGVYALGGVVTVESTIVRDVRPNAGALGDGIVALTMTNLTKLTVAGSLVSGAGRSGVSSFGADVTIGGTRLECNAIDLDGENHYGFSDKTFDHPFSFTDAGGNACGCMGTSQGCHAKSSSLAPPVPADTKK